jgi:tetratricopeptide (TPR) repeat protein
MSPWPPDGSLWVLAPTRSFDGVVWSRWPAPAGFFLTLFVLGLLISAGLRGRAENKLATEQALVATAGDLPGIDFAISQHDIDSQARSLRWKLCTVLVGLSFAAFAVELTVWRVWPEAPAWIADVDGQAFVLLACVGIWLWNSRRRSDQTSGEERRIAHIRAALWAPVKLLPIVPIFLFSPHAPPNWVHWLIHNSTLAREVNENMAVIPIVLILFGRKIMAELLAQPALRVGDYDRALRWIRRLSFGRPGAELLQMQGLALVIANRPVEAERCLRQALAKCSASLLCKPGSLLALLGDALTDEGRYEEATKCLQGTIVMGDNRLGSARIDLAELLLRQGIEPLKALELVDEAMRRAWGPVAAKVEPSRSAAQAWALALLGRRQEAEQAIERAIRVRRETGAGLFARTRLKVGMALVAMDQTEKAIEHFRAAYEADRAGKYGALALQQLKLHSAGDQ